MIKGFFFDLDGTLVDTHQANYEAYKRALADANVDITFEEFKKYIGEQAKDFLPKLAPSLSEEGITEVATAKAGYYKELAHLSRLNETLYEFVRTMSKDYVTALVTTAKQKNAETILQHHNLKNYFNIIITAEDVENTKPSPEAYQLALRKSGLKNNEVITFEDSEVGRAAAEAAGIPVVMIRDFAV